MARKYRAENLLLAPDNMLENGTESSEVLINESGETPDGTEVEDKRGQTKSRVAEEAWTKKNLESLKDLEYFSRLHSVMNTFLVSRGAKEISEEIWLILRRSFFPNYFTKRSGVKLSVFKDKADDIRNMVLIQRFNRAHLFLVGNDETSSLCLIPGEDLIDLVEAAKSSVSTAKALSRYHGQTR